MYTLLFVCSETTTHKSQSIPDGVRASHYGVHVSCHKRVSLEINQHSASRQNSFALALRFIQRCLGLANFVRKIINSSPVLVVENSRERVMLGRLISLLFRRMFIKGFFSSLSSSNVKSKCTSWCGSSRKPFFNVVVSVILSLHAASTDNGPY